MGQPPVIDEKNQDSTSIASLSVAIVEDARTLVQKQLELFGIEIQERIAASTRGLAASLVLGSLAIFAIQLLVVGALLYWAETQQVPLHVCLALTGAWLLLLCVAGIAVAVFQVRRAGSALESPKVMRELIRKFFRRTLPPQELT